jgi:RecA-family ATPase
MDDPFAETRRLIAQWDAIHNGASQSSARNQPLDLLALRDMDFNYDWLVEKFWPVEAHMHIFAAPKTGKSLLMLWIAANLALGRDPFSWEPIKRYRVSYVDNEMTWKDLQERLNDMGLAFDELAGWLLYYSYPVLAPMDTQTGGLETLEMMQAFDSTVLIIDTLSRVVKGEENSNDTYRNFYNHTGRLLKANAVAMARLDHAGHDPHKSRGASAKADDVDLVYGLEKRTGNDESQGYRLNRTHARMANVSETIELALTDEPVSIKSTRIRLWSENAIRKAKELEALGVPLNASQRDAIKALRDAGIGPGKTVYLNEALRLRNEREPFKQFGL